MSKILQIGEKVLREKANEVKIKDIPSKEIQRIIKGMSESLSKEYDGVAIAAPQIGYTKRIFIISDKIFSIGKKNTKLVYINPKLVSLSKESVSLDEGCLSVRWKYGKVKRRKKVKIEAYDEGGKKFQRGASGLLAQIFQHEIDHLNGILFVDKAKDLIEYKPEDLTN